MRRLAAALALVTLVAVAPPVATRILWPDAQAPAGLGRPVAEFGAVLASQLDRPLTHARFVRLESGRDSLLILFFELRRYPFLGAPELAYLVSRCVAIEALDPWGMSGGIIEGDPAFDPELDYLRSAAQPSCPVVR